MRHNLSVYASGQSRRIVTKYELLMACAAGTRGHQMPTPHLEVALSIEKSGQAA
ncbi:MAG: hypothetical protein ABSA73_09025 [Terracidiphilus sp.]